MHELLELVAQSGSDDQGSIGDALEYEKESGTLVWRCSFFLVGYAVLVACDQSMESVKAELLVINPAIENCAFKIFFKKFVDVSVLQTNQSTLSPVHHF